MSVDEEFNSLIVEWLDVNNAEYITKENYWALDSKKFGRIRIAPSGDFVRIQFESPEPASTHFGHMANFIGIPPKWNTPHFPSNMSASDRMTWFSRMIVDRLS